MTYNALCVNLIVAAFFALGFNVPALAVSFETVHIGNPNNPADTRYDPVGVGAVPYSFRMSRTEVTNAQYVEFLNAITWTDVNTTPFNGSFMFDGRNGILGGGSHFQVKPPTGSTLGEPNGYTFGDKPVVFISYVDAMRFVNWLHNGQPTGPQSAATTENGVYDIANFSLAAPRQPGARFWLPNRDEWHKAAYYDPIRGIYYDFTTGSDSQPNNNPPAADTGNSANYWLNGTTTTGHVFFPFTDVGSYKLSSSPYGTYDQGGNAEEWVEGFQPPVLNPAHGGSWADGWTLMTAQSGRHFLIGEDETNGFRIATVAIPEPSALSLLALVWILRLVPRPNTIRELRIKGDG